ncbi:MAG: DUF952 domain-containing protein [Hyphomicrobiaceae bacterium]|nr:MAG: DUF952 domain-containing protein [Hyphomicrobiaceae bacterium]
MSGFVFKVVAAIEWRAALARGAYAGSADDRRDGYIHLSSACQLRGTLDKHFAGRKDLLLIALEPAKLSDGLKWEPSRAGELFPHFYGDLPVGAAQWTRPLPLDARGRHVVGEDVD